MEPFVIAGAALLHHFIQHLVKRELFCFCLCCLECAEKSICWLICQTLDCVSGISAVSWSGEKLPDSAGVEMETRLEEIA